MPTPSDDELNSLRALKTYQEDLNQRIRKLRQDQELLELTIRRQELVAQKNQIEAQLSIIENRNNLLSQVEEAENICQSTDFKTRFCQLYNKRFSTLVDLSEPVIEVLLSISFNLPITLPALIAIKLGKIGIENYCSDVNSKS